MKKTAVIYWSGTGNTEAMANAVAEGMKEAGAEVTVMTADQVDANALSYSAIAFSCPAMGSEVRHQCRAVRFLRLGRRRMDAQLGEGLQRRRRESGVRKRYLLRSSRRRCSGRLPRAGQGLGKISKNRF